ncbi:MAG: peptide deformylase [Proteobacteria bacterium]|nr:peptide deformylase [Pseudomonadota bacterium]
MAVMEILTYPNPFLKTFAAPVREFDQDLRKTVEDMIDCMYKNSGVGLAATQVGIDKRLFVMDVNYNKEDPDSKKEPIAVINPEIIQKSGEKVSEEGCLSVPEFRAEINRASEIALGYQDLDGKTHQIDADGLLAVCIQHETDHLEGKLFIDHLPPLKRKMIQNKLKKRAVKQS